MSIRTWCKLNGFLCVQVEEEANLTHRRLLPPTLPPPPPHLSPQELKRRHIVAAIVHSENSYLATLHRLVNVRVYF